MSYYCGMSVVKASSELDAFHKAQEVMRFLKTEAGYKWYIKENIYYIARDINRHCKDKQPGVTTDCYVLMQRHFNITFVYYPKLKLLGCTNPVFNKAFPKAKTLCFQDSCDQDYDKKDWRNIRTLNAIYDKWMECPKEDVMSSEHWYADEDTDIDSYLPYVRRTLAYQEIEEMFCIHDYLYGEDNPDFIRFCMTPLDSQEIAFDIAKNVRSVYLSDKDNFIY